MSHQFSSPEPLLDVQHFSMSVAVQPTVQKQLIHDVSFTLARNEVVVLLGQSGSGKTVLSRSLTKLFPSNVPATFEGSVRFQGKEILTLDENGLRPLRRTNIRYIFQEPAQALNPVARIREQLNHSRGDGASGDELLLDVLEKVGLPHGREILELYPHQLSIGMAQRVLIGMAILPHPRVVIADEPTSAVDPPLRYQLLELLDSIQRAEGMSMILITHDLDEAKMFGSRVIVLYDGRVIESAERATFFTHPLHPYSRLLVESAPAVNETPRSFTDRDSKLMTGKKTMSGCRFHERCPIAEEPCSRQEPALERADKLHEVRCFYWK